MKRWILALMLPLLACFLSLSLAEDAFSFSVPARVTGYSENTLAVSAPASGLLTIQVADTRGNVWRTLAQQVDAGDIQFAWDGLGECDERLTAGAYTLRASLTTADGQTLQAQAAVRLTNAQALRFALPSGPVLYRGAAKDEKWFVELSAVKKGRIRMEVYAASDLSSPVLTARKQLTSNGVFCWKWDGGGLPEGDYELRLWAEENPAYVCSFSLSIRDDAPPVGEVTATGSVLPVAMDDATIWAAMMQPSVVAALDKPTDHQKIYALPDTGSEVLGTVHGQSQGMEVIDLEDEWALVTAWNHECGMQVTGYVPRSVLQTVTPNASYGVLINKQAQTMTVYQEGQRIGSVKISTGLMAPDKLFRETPAGAYLTVERIPAFTDGPYTYRYPIRYDGGNLLHQVGYEEKKDGMDFSDEAPLLGSKASHGCIRVDRVPGEGGINAYWLWTHLPYHTRVLILDDPQARSAASLALTVPEAIDEAPVLLPDPPAEEEVPILTAEPDAEDTILRLTFGGDAVLGTREGWWRKPEALPAYLAEYGMSWPFSGLADVFGADDMTLVNLECVLKADKNDMKTDKQFCFRGLPAWAEALKLGSIEQVNIANNHYIDYDSRGKRSTRDALTAAGIPFSGYTYTHVWETSGFKIGFAGCRETMFKRNTGLIREETQLLRNLGCDVVIYSCHWGAEYSPLHNELQEQMAHAAADAGVDLVVGTHPHVVQGAAQVGRTAVLWSLGNLMFGGTIDLSTFDAALVTAELHFDQAGYKGALLTYVPILTSSRAAEGINDYRPVPAQGEDAQRILSLIQADSGLLDVSSSMWFPAR